MYKNNKSVSQIPVFLEHQNLSFSLKTQNAYLFMKNSMFIKLSSYKLTSQFILEGQVPGAISPLFGS
jgi:hypothetical protein